MHTHRVPLPTFRQIVFATDFSKASEEAFRVACSLARAEASNVTIVHVDEPTPLTTDLISAGDMPVMVLDAGDSAERAESLERQLRERFIPHQPIPVDYLVCRGTAADAILSTANATHGDLIVMATQGRGGLSRMLFGSVAEEVMRKAPCPTVTVRASAAAGPSEAEPAIPTILVATDFSPASLKALRLGRSLARDRGARLVLLHVVPFDLIGEAAPAIIAFDDSEQGELEALRRSTDGTDLKYPVEARLRQGDPAGEILANASELGCSLVVLGTHGRSGIRRVLLGSVAEGVMRKAPCPVLTLKCPIPAPSPEPMAAARTTP